MLHVIRSSDADRLADELATWLADDPLPDPMAAERVVVASRGTERWLSHRLSERLGAVAGTDGVCANVDFPFPAQMVRELVFHCTGEPLPKDDPWRPERLVWTVLEVLPDLVHEPPFAQLRAYVGEGSVADRRRWSLARRVADRFDRYAVHRSGMALAWSTGDDVGPDGRPLHPYHSWQPMLWRHLERHLGAASLAARLDDTLRVLRGGEPVHELPPRVVLFGTSALPPVYLELLGALAARAEVRLYVTTPSVALWERVAACGDGIRAASEPLDPDSFGIAVSHPLLVTGGRLARDFQISLERHRPWAETAGEAADEPATLLARVQAYIVADRDRGRPGGEWPALPADVLDSSIQVHVCHGPARQVEVLRDVLLAVLDDNPDLEPRDVLVMTPDVETYAPLVMAAFGSEPRLDGDPPRLPVRIADRTLRRTNFVADTLLAVLDAVDSRLEASRVLDLLGREPIAARFGLAASDLETIQGWVIRSGIRWGMDAAHRRLWDQPDDRWHTWEFGLDRLLLGVAMTSDDDRVIADVAPYDDMEGDDVALVGRLADACDALFTTVRQLRDPRPLADWALALHAALEVLFATPDEDRWRLQQVQETVDDVARAGGEALLDLPALRAGLAAALDEPAGRVGYETGAVTFSALVPLRSIPHEVICLVGMDDGVFPRLARPAGFDLLAAGRHVGDRDPREEDRYLFLEAVLAARRHLLVTYTGRDVRTNERRPPAVPVGELLDVVDRAVDEHDGRRASERMTIEHPLQAFSPDNFAVTTRRPRPLGFDPRQLEAARALRRNVDETRPFVSDPLRVEDGGPDEVEIGELIRFFRAPTRWFLNRRLGMWLGDDLAVVEDGEPVEADHLMRWRIGDELLRVRRAERDEARWEDALFARGEAPTGAPGRAQLAEVRTYVDAVLEAVAPHRTGPAVAVDIRLDLAPLRVVGTVPDLCGDVLVRETYSRPGPRHLIAAWIEHLAATATTGNADLRTLVAGRGKPVEVCLLARPPDVDASAWPAAAAGILGELVGLFAQGCERPLVFFPETSYEFARRFVEGASEDAGLDEARKKWDPQEFSPVSGECEDSHVAQVYGFEADLDDVAYDGDFAAVARTVWEPFLAARSDT
jgi:exodeoxyribonuclease V gamma subunit